MEQDECLAAKKKAMSLLEHMDRTEWQLRDKLETKGFSGEAVEQAIAYVKSFHYLDDARYAHHFVEFHYETRSRQRLRQDLRQRHVSEEDVENALEEICPDDRVALQAAVAKLRRGETQWDADEKRKAAGKLYRKGFQSSDICRVLEM